MKRELTLSSVVCHLFLELQCSVSLRQLAYNDKCPQFLTCHPELHKYNWLLTPKFFLYNRDSETTNFCLIYDWQETHSLVAPNLAQQGLGQYKWNRTAQGCWTLTLSQASSRDMTEFRNRDSGVGKNQTAQRPSILHHHSMTPRDQVKSSFSLLIYHTRDMTQAVHCIEACNRYR